MEQQLFACPHYEGTTTRVSCPSTYDGDCIKMLITLPHTAFIADFVAYYKVLGFSKIYAYILDPGPETLKVIRRVSDADATLQPIRWAVHQSFKHSTTDQHKPFRNFLVDPDLWNVPAIATLDDDDEFEMGGVVSHERDFRMWCVELASLRSSRGC